LRNSGKGIEVDEADVRSLIRHPLNPREGDVGAIAASIQRNGWFGTVVVQRSTNYVLAGNHRLEAAKMLGYETVPVYWVDVDDDTAKRILLADNRTSDLASYNLEQLAEVLKDLALTDDLEGTGWDGDDIDSLLHTANKMPMDYPEPNVFQHKCPSCGYRWAD
jgi:ParB-like chromosome segregation protein Spo0J